MALTVLDEVANPAVNAREIRKGRESMFSSGYCIVEPSTNDASAYDLSVDNAHVIRNRTSKTYEALQSMVMSIQFPLAIETW